MYDKSDRECSNQCVCAFCAYTMGRKFVCVCVCVCVQCVMYKKSMYTLQLVNMTSYMNFLMHPLLPNVLKIGIYICFVMRNVTV